MLVPLREAIKKTGLSANTLRKYADNGTIQAVRVRKRKQRLFDVDSLLGSKKSQAMPVVCYCRVSSAKQKEDLARQVAFMWQKFPEAEIVQDIGSGLNFKRKGLETILQRLLQGDKLTLIIAHRDRLCRFGCELFEFLLTENGGELLVLDNQSLSPQRELTEDLLAILHVFSCRMHVLRRYANVIKEDKTLSVPRAENRAAPVVRGGEEVL